jgi:hypothetical protein
MTSNAWRLRSRLGAGGDRRRYRLIRVVGLGKAFRHFYIEAGRFLALDGETRLIWYSARAAGLICLCTHDILMDPFLTSSCH